MEQVVAVLGEDRLGVELDAAVVRATYDVHVTGEVSVETTKVQRGKGAITTTYGDEVDATSRTVVADSRTCVELVGESPQVVDVAICEAVGMYDLNG